MNQILDDGKIIHFGQSIKEIEAMFAVKAEDILIRIARKGIDKGVKAGNLSLEFDSGKLKRIRFEGGYDFKNPLTPYPELWKNFVPIGSAGISGRMPREEFLIYLKAWEERAKACGAQPVEAGEDLASEQYSVGIVQESLMGFSTDIIAVNMGPSRVLAAVGYGAMAGVCTSLRKPITRKAEWKSGDSDPFLPSEMSSIP